ncbi:MAG: HD-GYP domain-containing protein [Actinomycetota bacterium]
MTTQLHDIGEISIPDKLVLKNEKLTKKEWGIMKKHPEIGFRIAGASLELYPIVDSILHHHEWYDGSGYPHVIKGNEIPLISRIISIVEAYEAMIEGRPCREEPPPEIVLQEIRRYSGIQFDPELAEIFISEIKKQWSSIYRLRLLPLSFNRNDNNPFMVMIRSTEIK